MQGLIKEAVMLYYVHVDIPLKRAIIHLETCGHARNREKMAANG